jgi:ABC-2 type transport system permease protein
MSAAPSPAAVRIVATPARTAPARAVTALAVRQVRRGALVLGGFLAGMSALVVATYTSTVGGAGGAAGLAALAENPAVRTLFGEPVALDDPGGFAVWRTGTAVAVAAAAWALLASTRITRGEEEAGRWDLLLAGRVPLQGVVARHLAVVVTALLLAGAATTAALVLAGTRTTGALLHGTGVALTGIVFAALATTAAQVLPSRSAATGATAGLMGALLLARMVGDGVDALGWLRWLSPFGLVALVRPFDADRLAPLAVLAVVAVILVLLAPAAARGRDVGAGRTTLRARRAPRRALLGSVPGFAVRRVVRPLAGWCLAVGAYFLLIGLLAVSMTEFLTENPQFADLAARAGFGGLGTVEGYAASLFAVLALPVGALAAIRVAALAADETARRLTLLHAGPVTRTRLLGAEAAVAAAAAVAVTVTAGLATWAGATAVGAGLGPGPALAGALNVLPVAALCLGAAVLALGWLPRAVALVGVLPAVGGFLLQVLADSTGAPRWVHDLSPFAHLARVPAVEPDWGGAAVMLAVALALGTVGAVGYRRRDLRG